MRASIVAFSMLTNSSWRGTTKGAHLLYTPNLCSRPLPVGTAPVHSGSLILPGGSDQWRPSCPVPQAQPDDAHPLPKKPSRSEGVII